MKVGKILCFMQTKQLRIFMARSTGRKRFWFQQNRITNKMRNTEQATK
jgi:hypothetical protein